MDYMEYIVLKHIFNLLFFSFVFNYFIFSILVSLLCTISIINFNKINSLNYKISKEYLVNHFLNFNIFKFQIIYM